MANGARTLPVERRYRAAVSGTTVSPRFSAFAAALLSALIPGLGQAYQRRWGAALALVAPPFLLSAVVGGIYAADGPAGLLGMLLSPIGLSAAGILNLVAAGWRLVAAVDAWRSALTRGAGLRPLLLSANSAPPREPAFPCRRSKPRKEFHFLVQGRLSPANSAMAPPPQ